MRKETGGSAFPRSGFLPPQCNYDARERAQYVTEPCDGMTVRQWYAGQALVGLIAGFTRNELGLEPGSLATMALAIADAMIAREYLEPSEL
jgi:hypothetical protein